MSLYLKNNYITKVEWDRVGFVAKATFPPNIISDIKREQIVKTYKLEEDKLIVNDTIEYDCPSYGLRTAIAVDLFCGNVQCNIPCSEIYYFDYINDKYFKFAIKYLTMDFPKDVLIQEHCLAEVFSAKESERQTLSKEFDVEIGFEFVSNFIANGGLK